MSFNPVGETGHLCQKDKFLASEPAGIYCGGAPASGPPTMMVANLSGTR